MVIGDLIQVPGILINPATTAPHYYGVVSSVGTDKVGAHWWAQAKAEALTKAFHVCVNSSASLSFSQIKVLASPCHPLWGKIQKDDLIKIPKPDLTGLAKAMVVSDKEWYGIASNIEVTEQGDLIVTSSWKHTIEEVKATGPKTLGVYPITIKTLEVVARPWNSPTVYTNTGATGTITILPPSCTCKSLIYGCSCQYSVFMKTKRVAEGKIW